MTVNGKDYEVLRLLGKGKGGYSYLVTDGVQQYVLKQIHHEPCDYYQFGDKLQSELRDYRRLREIGIPMPEMLAVDAEQEYILKEYIEGDTIDRLVARDEMIPDYLELTKACVAHKKPCYIMPTYTAMLSLRSTISKHFGFKAFWE